MMINRIFPRALPPVGVTSRSWLGPPHLQLSYETNPFGSFGSDASLTPWWRERVCNTALQRRWESRRV